jgi:hypothetical protein
VVKGEGLLNLCPQKGRAGSNPVPTAKMTFMLTVVIGFVLAFVWEYFCVNIIKRTVLIVWDWRLHHSLYGLLFLILGFLVQNIIFIGLGIGIVVQHTFTDGFRFVSKK